VSGYKVIMFDGDITITVGGNDIDIPAHKELGIGNISELIITGSANYMMA